MDISKYAEYWENKDKWFLVEFLPRSYVIEGQLDNGIFVIVTIEDDDEYHAVTQKMLKSRSRILTMEEFSQLNQPPEFADIAPETLKEMKRQFIENYKIDDYLKPDKE